jgi:hypothetical protein
MIAKSKSVLALLGIALLVFNPAGICAGTPSAHAPSHPCCPAPPTSNHSSGTGACICIDRQPAAPALPSLHDGQDASVAATQSTADVAVSGDETVPAPNRSAFVHEARFIILHQLLV